MKHLKFISFVVALLVMITGRVSGQFEQKVTLHASGSFHYPVGEKAFTDKFGNGFSIDGGFQFNFSRTFSLVTLLKYTTYKVIKGDLISEGNYKNAGISLCPKLRFFASKKVNPYIYAGGNMNIIGFSYTDVTGQEYNYSQPLNFGYTGGLGFDFKIGDHFALFLQGGYNSIHYVDKNDPTFKMNINSAYAEAGFNLSFFKSKSL